MSILGQVGTKLFTAKTLTEVGFIRPMRPDKLLRTGLNFVRWGPTPAAGYATGSLLYPDELFDFYQAEQIPSVAFNVEEIEGPNTTSSLPLSWPLWFDV